MRLQNLLLALFDGPSNHYKIMYVGSGGPGDEYYTIIDFDNQWFFDRFIQKMHIGEESGGEIYSIKQSEVREIEYDNHIVVLFGYVE